MQKSNSKNRLDKFNLWMYNFIATILPYSTSLPVAVLTANSVKEFLGLDPYSAGVLVFGLEAIGLLCTSLLVDAVVSWIRSRNAKAFAPILLFGTVVFVYIRILISLNVTLEKAAGNINPALTDVITLLCYVPLLAGVLAGWNKLRIEDRNKNEQDKLHDEEVKERHRLQQIEVTERDRKAEREAELAKLRIQEEQKTARAKVKADALATKPAPVPAPVYQQVVPNVKDVASKYKQEMYNLVTEVYTATSKLPRVKHLADEFNLDYEKNKGYISTLIKQWKTDHNIQ